MDGTTAKPLNVLVVEDDDINRMVCIRYLESLGHTFIESSDGIQALVKLQVLRQAKALHW